MSMDFIESLLVSGVASPEESEKCDHNYKFIAGHSSPEALVQGTADELVYPTLTPIRSIISASLITAAGSSHRSQASFSNF